MEDILEIKKLKQLTDCGLLDCKNAYEESGKDFEKALALLNSNKPTVKPIELTDAEKNELENYKVKAEKRAKRKSSKLSKQKKTAVVCYVFSAFFLSLFICCLITEIVLEEHTLLACTIISAIMSVSLVIAGKVIGKMSNEEFASAREPNPKEIIVGDNDIIICPRCGSEHLTYQKKGFSEAKALIGMSLIGVWGAMFGVPGKDKIKATCLKCGHSFMIKKK